MSFVSTLRPRRGTALILLATVLAALLVPGSVTFAANGPIQWCPAPLDHNADGCADADTIQAAINLAAAAKAPGTIFVNSGDYTGDVTINKLSGVRFIGRATGSGVTTIDGVVAMNSSANITFANFVVTGGITVTKASGKLLLDTNTSPATTITKSGFSKNNGNGLTVAHHIGDITLTAVTATGNDGAGVSITTTGSLVGTGITAVSNTIYGVDVIVTGSATLTNVKVVNSGFDGLSMSADTLSLTTVTATSSHANGLNLSAATQTTLTRVTATKNVESGIMIIGNGVVTLSDITASLNGIDGGRVAVTGPITVNTVKSKLNHFDKNGSNGLVMGTPSTITVSDISASKNLVSGAVLNGTAGITVNTVRGKLNRFDSNQGVGLFPTSNGPIEVSDISASKNVEMGMRVSTGNTLDITTVHSTMNHFDGNQAWGIFAVASGAMTLADITANGNFDQGIYAQVDAGLLLTTNHSKLNHFDKNHNDGIAITGTGAVNLFDISAVRNTGDGIRIETSGEVQVLLNKAKKNIFDRNTGHGLEIATDTFIMVYGSSVTNSTQSGLKINISTASSAIVSCSTIKGNHPDILDIMSGGDITLAGVILTKPDQSTIDNTGGNLLTQTGCLL